MGKNSEIAEPAKKPRLMLLGHTYMIAANREKANALAEFFEVCVCTPDSEGWMVMGKEVRDTEADLRPRFYQLHRLRRWPRTQKYTAIFLRGLNQIVHQFQPDVILVECEPWSLLRWQARICTWRSAPATQFAEFTWENVRRPGWKGIFFNMIYQCAARTTCKVICGNRGAAKLFTDAGLPPERIHIDGQLGICESEFPLAGTLEKQEWRKSLGWNADDFVVGYCGRLVEEKGIRELAQAVMTIRGDYPNVKLAMLGNGRLQQELEQIHGASDWLRILPPLPHQQVYCFLNKLDLFILPSKPLHRAGKYWEEQFGHVLIEAITAGVFTIGSDSGAIPEVLRDPQWIFRHGSTEAILEILKGILERKEQIPSLQSAQRKICLENWNHRTLARRYAEFLQLSDDNKPSRPCCDLLA